MRQRPYLKLLTKAGPLVALTLAIALTVGTAGPASAQFFNFGGSSRSAPRGGGWFGGWFGGGGGGFFAPHRTEPAPPRRVYQDFSKAPPPEKRDTVPKRTVLVLGDSMADWLAYGLEDAYADQPDIGILRKVKTVSGLIQYQPRGAPADWIAAAKDILATEKPDVIVVMLGLSDRIPIHEPTPEKTEKQKKNGKNERKPDRAADAKSQPDGASETGAKPEEKADDTESPPDDAADTPPEKHPRSPNGIAQFHDERWIELYNKKIDEMIAVLKSKGVPVVWVGLPAVRGPKGTADTLFLDSLYRGAADKAGITYVDDWDGFVDEAGRFVQKGPDFEGQIRLLRTYDGVYFTKYGARKLAHYVEREVTRLLAARSGPVALPTEPATPDTKAAPGQPAPRPLAGPIVPLVAASVSTDRLLGGPGSRPAPVDALAAQTLVKGEPLAPPPGRADDFAWPRRQVGDEPAKGDVPVAATAPTAPAAPQAASAGTSSNGANATPKTPPKPSKPPLQPQHKPTQPHEPSLMNFFRFGAAPKQPAPARPPRPPANVGRSAGVQ
jgi:hypothetical protein